MLHTETSQQPDYRERDELSIIRPILIIEDDPDIAEVLRFNLERDGLTAIVSPTAEEGLKHALDQENPPVMFLLDLMLPGMSGLELCRRLRLEPQTRRTPLIMMTAKTSESDRIKGLDLGADDYISKPFSVREVLARVRAVLRRSDHSGISIYEDESLSIDFADVRVYCKREKIKLTYKEFSLLSMLAKNADRVRTRQQLLDDVWGQGYYGDGRTLDVHILRLRQKLGGCGNCIETVSGVGYRFVGCSGAAIGDLPRES